MFRTYKYNHNNGVKQEMRIHIQKSIQISMEKINKNNIKGLGLSNNIYSRIIFGK